MTSRETRKNGNEGLDTITKAGESLEVKKRISASYGENGL